MKLFLIILGITIISVTWFLSRPTPASSSLDSFAKCLAEKKVTMYGADWCPHCQEEKKAFGSSFKYVPYVECPRNPKACLDKGIEGYPTWIMGDGSKLIGEQGLQTLSEKTGCSLINR